MTSNLQKLSKKDSTELIVYQLGEVKNLLENMTIKFDNYKDATDKRIADLEKFQVTQITQNNIEPRVDVQKIVLAAFSLISTIVALALGINQTKIIK